MVRILYGWAALYDHSCIISPKVISTTACCENYYSILGKICITRGKIGGREIPTRYRVPGGEKRGEGEYQRVRLVPVNASCYVPDHPVYNGTLVRYTKLKTNAFRLCLEETISENHM